MAFGAVSAETPAITPHQVISLFNGKDLSCFYTWLELHRRDDPDQVFTVIDQIDGGPAIRISGQQMGGIITKQRYANYRLVAQFRWGHLTWGARKKLKRISGILLHCQGEDGNYKPDFSGAWMRSVEYEIMEGGTGDIILVGGYERGRTERIWPLLRATVRPGPRAPLWSPEGAVAEFGAGKAGRIYWRHKDPEQIDITGFRGRADVERPVGEWNDIVALCDGGNIAFFLNGEQVNGGTAGTFKEGAIEFQSEGAEIYFRHLELHPIER